MKTLLKEAEALYLISKGFKDALHRQPELSFQERKTTALIKEVLGQLNIDCIDLGLDTGVVGWMEGGLPGRAVMLRAEIDAIQEHESEAATVRSEIPGIMHACGHDFHTAALLGAAFLLSKRRERMRGGVVFLFQPGEETLLGAPTMLEAGLMSKLSVRPDAIFGLHGHPDIEAGKIAVIRGALMAQQSQFSLMIRGTSGHGGTPHCCTDVIVAAAAIINGIQTIVSRDSDPFEPVVCSVNAISGGDETNQVCDSIRLGGCIRAMSQLAHDLICRRLKEMSETLAHAYRCVAFLQITPSAPLLSNSDCLYTTALDAALAVAGEDAVVTHCACLASEDFAFYREVLPSFLYWVGTGYQDRPNPGWHSTEFCTNDAALPYATALYAASALVVLEQEADGSI